MTISRFAVPMTLAVVVWDLAAGGAGAAADKPPRKSHRRTPLVELFEACKDSVVNVAAVQVEVKPAPPPKAKTPGAPKSPAGAKAPRKMIRIQRVQWGSGSIVHEAGYILTNRHVLKLEGRRTVSLFDGKSYPFRVVAVDEGSDLALLKVDAGRPLEPLKLGRSSDLMIGEPAIVIGNPFGLRHTLAQGIVSGLDRTTTTPDAHLTHMIQTDASVNPGNSGGPLLNMDGELVGVVTCVRKEAENVGFAIPIDTVRARLPDIVSPEQRYGFVLGAKVATDGPATVAEVAKDSPAEAAGLRVGDLVAAVDGTPLREGIDFYLALVNRKGGQSLPLKLRRDGKALDATVALGTVALRPAEKVDGLVKGLDLKVYLGRWTKLPDFDRLKPRSAATAPLFSLANLKDKECFGLRFTGYLAVPADGIYIFCVRADDGARLYIGGQLVVDNDGLHPAITQRGFAALRAGQHPIRVTYFQGPGDAVLEVFYQGPGIKRQEIPPSALHRASATSRPKQPTRPPAAHPGPKSERPMQAGRRGRGTSHPRQDARAGSR